MAKEILDQVHANFKRQAEGTAEMHPPQQSAKKAEFKYDSKYEPSENFHTIFSGLMGEKKKVSNKIGINENPKLHATTNERNKAAGLVPQNSDGKNESTKIMEPPKTQQNEEKTSKPLQPSVFQKLYHAGKTENPEHEQKKGDLAQVSDLESKQKEKSNSTPPVSVFQKLSRSSSSG